MPRDPDGIQTTKWGGAGDRATPESQGMTRSVGWTSAASQPGAREPKREVFQQLLSELYAFLKDANEHGLLEWHANTPFKHPALCIGSDGNVYASVRDSTGVDPTTDTNDDDWTLFPPPVTQYVLTALAVLNVVQGTRANADRGKVLAVSATDRNALALLAQSAIDAGSVDGASVWRGTRVQYNAITTKDANTLYVVRP